MRFQTAISCAVSCSNSLCRTTPTCWSVSYDADLLVVTIGVLAGHRNDEIDERLRHLANPGSMLVDRVRNAAAKALATPRPG